jgi:inhibitor of cysteine peptidase
MLRRTVLFSLLAAALTVSGCKAGTSVVKAERDQTAGVRMGGILAVQLESNATTGYSWELAAVKDKRIVEEYGKVRYVQANPGLIGVGGYQLFRFKTLKKGETVLDFEYRRPWEKGVAPAKKRSVRVVVN